MFVDKQLLAAPVILVSVPTLEVVHPPPTYVREAPRDGESRSTNFRRRLVSVIVTGYALLVRWVPATLLVALLSLSPVAHADEQPSKQADDPAQAPPKPDAGELYQSVKTKKSRKDLSQFLVKAAEKAVKDRQWAKAIPLYQGLVVARGPASPEAKQLATRWTLAGQNEDAGEAWGAYASALTDAKAKADAQAEATRLSSAPDPFAEKLALTDM